MTNLKITIYILQKKLCFSCGGGHSPPHILFSFSGEWQSEPEQEYVLAESLFLSVRCT